MNGDAAKLKRLAYEDMRSLQILPYLKIYLLTITFVHPKYASVAKPVDEEGRNATFNCHVRDVLD